MAVTKQKRLPPIHPGQVLQDLLNEAGLTVNGLALALRVPANRIGAIIKGQRGITGTLPCASLATSGPLHSCGSICRPNTIWPLLKIASASKLNGRFCRDLPRESPGCRQGTGTG